MKLSLVIPCYNEMKNLPELVRRCIRVCEVLNCEIILVDNGSSDDSKSVMRTLIDGHDALRMVHVPVNKGYGFGILSGLEAATGDVMGWCHADLQTDPSDVIPAMAIFENTPNPERLFVKGLRKRRALSDTAFTIGMSFFETALFGRKLWDINAQPTLFHRIFYETLSDAPHDFSLDLYVYATARKRGIEVKRVPVFFPERQHGESSWNTNAAAKIKFIKRTIRYSFALKSHFNGRA